MQYHVRDCAHSILIHCQVILIVTGLINYYLDNFYHQ